MMFNKFNYFTRC